MAKKKGKSGGGDEGSGHGPTIENRKARHDYAISDTVEVGIVLRGSEVKSIRDGKVSLAEGYVRVDGAGRISGKLAVARAKAAAANGKPTRRATARPDAVGLFLHSVNIAEYPPAGPTGSAGQHVPTRTRTLLAHRSEIVRLGKEVEAKGTTLIPLKMYFKQGKAKVLVGVARGRTHADKREHIAKRDANRDIQRAMSRRV